MLLCYVRARFFLYFPVVLIIHVLFQLSTLTILDFTRWFCLCNEFLFTPLRHEMASLCADVPLSSLTRSLPVYVTECYHYALESNKNKNDKNDKIND